jgi:hypothetical protein
MPIIVLFVCCNSPVKRVVFSVFHAENCNQNNVEKGACFLFGAHRLPHTKDSTQTSKTYSTSTLLIVIDEEDPESF